MSRKKDQKQTIHSPEEFRFWLEREVSRAERYGSPLSLVILHLGDLRQRKDKMRWVSRSIEQRVRSLDLAGWLDEERLGIMLPCTDRKGAGKFAADLGRIMSRKRIAPPLTIRCYPDLWHKGISGGDRDPGDPAAPLPDRRTGEARRETGPGNESRAATQNELDSLFARKIPFWKRAMDVVLSVLVLLLFSPVLILVPLYVKLACGGSVLFKQRRIGYKGQPFTFFKFRTMREDNDPCSHEEYLRRLIHSDRPMTKLDVERDPRIIPGGFLIRRACLDEFPQLFNVLRGEMSLVGPRPCIPYEAREYLPWNCHRFDTLPGVTGLWQVSGKNNLTFKQMVRLDIAYTRRMSIWLDLKILLRTLPVILAMVFRPLFRRKQSPARPAETEQAAPGAREGGGRR